MLRDNYATWRCGMHDISLMRPRIMGVLNVTPDSFSDGGEHIDPDMAIEYGMSMLDAGADIIDVGGESTRPGHTPVLPEDELDRVAPVVEALCDRGAIVSIDTRNAEVARTCLELGASIINDVSGFTDPQMVELAAETDCGVIVMHWKQKSAAARKSVQLYANHPARRSVQRARRFTLPDEAPLMREVMGFLGDQARTLMRAGVSRDRICVDPGPGFDKSTDEDTVIQRNTKLVVSMGYPVMTAVSRKRFVGDLSAVHDPTKRDPATIGACLAAVASGSRLLRVHDVASAFEALTTYWSVSRSDSRQGFISLGSNVGDSFENLNQAVRLINKLPLTCVTSVSNAYETEPAYGIATPVVNAVAEIYTELHPLVLLDKLLDIEQSMGRERDERTLGHGPRTIDLDLCWIEGEVHHGARLELPHPRLGERDYVLVPMEDLMPDPVRFLTHGGVDVLPESERVGHVTADLGPLPWQGE
ncbi:MAG: dihydropteroate synthase [Coriobacteriales bacterium]|nr:dihydropteroate synthase [Coriobacteriales bacterium]